MPVAIKVDLTGEERFGRAIGRLALPAAAPIYRRAFERMAERVQETTRREFLAGQMLQRITGELQQSIEISPYGLPRYIEIGSALEQAPPLHFGWPRRNIRPSPFIDRSLDRSVPHFPAIWVREMEREMERVR